MATKKKASLNGATLGETEKRLRALPLLRAKLESDRKRLDLIRRAQAGHVVRVTPSGYRMTPEEAAAQALREAGAPARIEDLEEEIAADEREIMLLDRALSSINTDKFYAALSGKYFDGLDDEDIAKDLGCGKTRLWKKRRALLQNVAVMLYGAPATRT
jgi:DNA-directed RNA polymerase specialized sigma24 family protein